MNEYSSSGCRYKVLKSIKHILVTHVVIKKENTNKVSID